MWYLTRSTGIVATLLSAAALVWGFLFSARATGNRLRPAWWLDLHNWLGGLALVFIGVHIATSWLDSDAGIGLIQVFVPGSATRDAWAIGWGGGGSPRTCSRSRCSRRGRAGSGTAVGDVLPTSVRSSPWHLRLSTRISPAVMPGARRSASDSR